MKNKLRTLPVTLQNLLIYRVALAILALGASLALAIFLHDVHFALPGLILCVTMLVSATLLYRLLMQGRYLALRGTVLHVEQTIMRRHTKVIILEAEGKALRIQLRSRHIKVVNQHNIFPDIKSRPDEIHASKHSENYSANNQNTQVPFSHLLLPLSVASILATLPHFFNIGYASEARY